MSSRCLLLLVSLLVLACASSESDTGPAAGTQQEGVTGSSADGGGGDGTSGDSGQAGDTGQDLPDEYIYEEDPVQPDLSLDQVELAMSEAIASFAEVDIADYWVAYQQITAEADDDCPYYYADYEETYGYWYWVDSCSTGTGATYSGYAYGIISEPYWSGSYHYTDYGWMYGDFAIDSSDGQSLDFSGYARNYRYTYNGTVQGWYSYLVGDVRWTGDDFAGTWLQQTWSASYTISAYASDADSPSVTLSGGVSNMDGTANAIYFDSVWFGTAGAGSSCPDEPSGVVRIRDGSGEWYDVLFHGPAESGGSSFPEDCDGCGELWFRGTELGSVCPSFTPLLDWVGASR